jgi:glycosyltransferase involved in cell wall biosynthesis
MDGGIFQQQLEGRGVRVTCMGMHRGRISPAKWWRMVQLIRDWRPSLVQTWMYHADLLGGLAAFFSRVPLCWGVRPSDLSKAGNKASTLAAARFCALVSSFVPARAISCSVKAVETHRAFGYKVQFEVVPNGVDAELWEPRPELRSTTRGALGFDEDSIVFAHAGRGHPLKDHGNLALSFNRVYGVDPRARLLLCGEGLSPGHPYFQALPFTQDARNAVVALGPRDDLPWLWPAADVFVLSSVGEGFPNVLAEAMASGLPCVTTDAGDAAEIVGDAGVVVAPADPVALSEAMLAMASLSGSERNQLSGAARLRVLERFTLPKMVAGFHRVWDDVIAEARS